MFDGSGSIDLADHNAVRNADYEHAWRRVHERLRAIARTRIALEAEEATHLLEAEELGVFRRLGYVTMAEYLIRELSYTRHAANERMRVAHELESLPALAEEFADGNLCFSKVRELSRVATPETEDAFIAAARGKTSAQVEAMVAGLVRGDDPTTRPDPALIKKRLVLADLSPETYARFRRRRVEMKASLGRWPTDDEVMCSLLDGASTAPSNAGTRPSAQHGLTTCRHCAASMLAVAGGEALRVEPAIAERLRCDCIELGDLEVDESRRKRSAIPPKTREKVFLRDGFTCVVPGCTNTQHLDVHHIVHREDGGSNEPWNLCLLCFGHHASHHDGLLEITGRAPHALEFRWVRDDDEPVPRGTDSPS